MKKLLFLASYVFDTGEIEHKDQQQLVMVTDRDVAALTEKQRKLNPEKSMRRPFDHNEAAYDVFETWFKEVFPESTLKHVMIKRPIQSQLFPAKDREFTPNEFSGPHSCKDEFPPTEAGEDFTETVAIDLTGEMKHWDFGWYDHEEKKWVMQNQGELFNNTFELDHAVWFSPPKPR
jgi:hypothetical protein